MDRLILATNQIRDALASVQLDLGADLPQIAVVGGQSVGKSSVLEGLVQHTFLPTGSGVVTRRPLLLRLVQLPPQHAEWGEFGHLQGRRFESFAEIREEIVRDTERVCGNQKAVNPTPIVLQIYSPMVVDLTLIDLPGITRVPVGDQPQDIELQLRQLILDHIASPRCFILAVVAGNADLATADALAIAREVDPEGQRTLGVVTKLDLVDSSFDAVSILEGRVYPLRQGFVGVICRSFQDVQKGKDMKDHLQAEDQFFRNHRTLRSVASNCGTSYLAKRLNRILMNHICDALPDIKSQVMQSIHEHEAELSGYGESVSGRPLCEQGALLLSLFTKFVGRFGDAIDGRLASQRGEVPGPLGQLVGRARIDYIFQDVFAKTIKGFDTFSGLTDDEIRVAIRNATGPKATLFVPEAAFELLARKQINKLLAPCLQCVDLVFDELQRVLALSEVPEFRRFVHLREQVFNVVRNILRRCFKPTAQMVRDLIDIELAYINTSHPDFCGTASALRSAGAVGASPVPMRPAGLAGGPSTESPSDAAGAGTTADPAEGIRPPYRIHSMPMDATRASSSPLPSRPMFSGWNIFRSRRGSAPTDAVEEGGAARPNGTSRSSLGSLDTLDTAPRAALGRQGLTANSGALKLPHMPPTIAPASAAPTQRERVEVHIIKHLLDNYLAIVKKNIVDSVPKTIMHFMVNSLKDVIQSECVAQLYKEESFGTLLQEATDLQSKRAKCSARLKALSRVIEVAEQLWDHGVDAL